VLKKDSNYKKVRLGGRSWLNQSTYWIGPNHLLVVEVSNYVERYRRFYFRDVQAILVQNSAVRLGWNIGLGIFASLLLVGLLVEGLSAARDDVLVTLWFFFFFSFVVCLIINTLRGPSCTVHIRTAVQNQKLSGISRWRKADTLVAALTPLINAAQTSLPTAEQPDVAPAAGPQGLNVAEPEAPPRTDS
jgi:hypothetical protein